MNEGINLLDPDKKGSSTHFVHHIQKMRLFVLGLLFIVSVSSVILFTMVEISPLPQLRTQEQNLQQSLMQSQNDIVKLSIVNERMSSITSLLRTRPMLDQPLGLIEDKLSGDSTVTDIQSDDQTMTITVESPSLQSLDSFINGLVGYAQEKKGFSKVSLLDLTTDQVTNEYETTLNLSFL